MSKIELKPCPFCGTSPESEVHPANTIEGSCFQIECGKCGALWPALSREQSENFASDDDVTHFWNTRTDAAKDAEMERLREAVEATLGDFAQWAEIRGGNGTYQGAIDRLTSALIPNPAGGMPVEGGE